MARTPNHISEAVSVEERDSASPKKKGHAGPMTPTPEQQVKVNTDQLDVVRTQKNSSRRELNKDLTTVKESRNDEFVLDSLGMMAVPEENIISLAQLPAKVDSEPTLEIKHVSQTVIGAPSYKIKLMDKVQSSSLKQLQIQIGGSSTVLKAESAKIKVESSH